MSARKVFSMLAIPAVLVSMGLFVGVATASTITVAFQDGALTPTQAGGNGSTIYAGTTDTTIAALAPSDNSGGSVRLWAGDWGGVTSDINRILVNFNYGTLATYMQTNSLQIQSATLKMYAYAWDGTGGLNQTIDAFKLTTAFNEGAGTGTGRTALTGESCWNYQSYDATTPASSTPWAGGGAFGASDFGSTTLASNTVTIGTLARWYNFDVTNALAANGSDLSSQKGFLLLARTDPVDPNYSVVGKDQVLFASGEYATSGYHPTLELTLVSVPEPGTLALLVTGLIGLLAYAWRRRQ